MAAMRLLSFAAVALTPLSALLLAGGMIQSDLLFGFAPVRAAAPEVDIRRDAVVEAIEEVMPSVVNVSTETIVEVQDPLDQVFRDFFGRNWGRRSQQRSQHSLGSGVIIDETGYVLTNFHVVRRASVITVKLADGREFKAKPVVQTLQSDVALLKLLDTGGEKFKAIKFASDDDLMLGETVIALGNPFGLGGSVSRGILSSKARRLPIEDESLNVEDWLQTDAAINPGNSGGPLVNLRGELIGINVAVLREGQGIGFAIPVKRVSEALSVIFTPEWVTDLWFGARFQSSTNGVTATTIEPGSPAEKAGLKISDRVLSVNGKTPHHVVELNRELMAVGDRKPSKIEVRRENARRSLTVQLIPMASVFNAKLIREKIGVSLRELTPDLAATLGFGQLRGFLILEVEPSGTASKAGLKEGDLIQTFDGQTPQRIIDAARLLYVMRSGEKLRVDVVVPRRGRNFVQLFSGTKTLPVH